MSKLLILGAGGHGKVVLDIVVSLGQFKEIAFLDDNETVKSVLGYRQIGKIQDYKKLYQEYDYAIVAIGNNKLRLELTKKLKEVGYKIPVLIHPTAYVSTFANVGEGTVIMPKAVINANACIGEAAIINTGAIVEHDNQIGEGVHLSPNVSLGGSVIVGALSWIGIGATVINNITIGEKARIAAGAVVIRDVADRKLLMGIPARERMEVQ